MKAINITLLAIIAVMAYFMGSMYTTLENVTLELQSEKRYSHEVIKACEGHRYYLMNILDEHQIEYFK